MQIKQFENKNLSHYSYAILSDCEKKIILVDPGRDPQLYREFAKEMEATITGVIETHPHADFVSSHLELHQTLGATIYTSKLTEAHYPHETFDEGREIQLGKIKLSAINTPGHSPDSICVLLEHDGKQKAVFTGDTLFVGDCGRPDLREGDGSMQTKKQQMAKQLYHSLREKLAKLNDDVTVYPAHGAGTLCGKSLGTESNSTIGKEKQSNWSLQPAEEEEFIDSLLADQPFVPHYFSYDVALNRRGAAPFRESITNVVLDEYNDSSSNQQLDPALWVIDTRNEAQFKEGHLPHAVNLMEKGKFETWLGSLIKPDEKFYLAGESPGQLQRMISRAAAIGYENNIVKAIVVGDGKIKEPKLDVADFQDRMKDYTIIDVRNSSEASDGKLFPGSLSIPLPELRESVSHIPTGKPIVVHCAGGYRSAAASSLLHATLNGKVPVYDLGEAVKTFMKPLKNDA